jgi:hypothetical protein
VYSPRSIEDPREGNTPHIEPVFSEESASSGPRFSEHRVSLQDYAFALVLADAVALVGGGILLDHTFFDGPHAAGGSVSPYLITFVCYLLASIAFKSYSTSIFLNLREMMRRVFSVLGATFAFFLISSEMSNAAYERTHSLFFLGLVLLLLLLSVSWRRLTCDFP